MHIREDDIVDFQEDSDSWINFEVGHSIQVSESCNPNFILSVQFDSFEGAIRVIDCDVIEEFGLCDIRVQQLILNGVWNTNGHFETFLQCPYCGCGSEGATNLNDLYAAELES